MKWALLLGSSIYISDWNYQVKNGADGWPNKTNFSHLVEKSINFKLKDCFSLTYNYLNLWVEVNFLDSYHFYSLILLVFWILSPLVILIYNGKDNVLDFSNCEYDFINDFSLGWRFFFSLLFLILLKEYHNFIFQILNPHICYFDHYFLSISCYDDAHLLSNYHKKIFISLVSREMEILMTPLILSVFSHFYDQPFNDT